MQNDQMLQMHDGQMVVLPPWKGGQAGYGKTAKPDVFESETGQMYPIGTSYIDGDRLFKYLYVGGVDATYTKANIGLYCAVVEDASLTTDAVIHAIAEDEIVIEKTTGAVNKWAGGYFMPRVNPYSSYRILSSTVSDGEHVTLTIEHGLIVAVGASQGSCHLVENPYKDARCTWAMGRDDVGFVGITLMDTILTTYQWVQVAGPCHVVPYNEEMGAAANVQQGCFHIDGTVIKHAAAARQHMGYAIPHTGTTSTWFIMLQVATL